MVLHKTILILEDDLEALEFILRVLKEVSIGKRIPISVTVIPDYERTIVFINNNPHFKYDLLLLDRDCYLGGSFHIVNLDNFDKDKVISISSVPEYNEKAVGMGVKRVVWKDYKNLDDFSQKLKAEIIKII